VDKPNLDGVSIEALIEHLKSPEAWTRHQARKELSERDADDVLASVEDWVDRLSPETVDYDHHLVEAMWACQNVERPSEKIVRLVLNAGDGHARSAGARIIRYWHEQLSDPVAMVTEACGDSFPRTRMEAVLSAGFIPNAQAYAAALRSVDHPGDPFLDQALPQTRKALERYWRPALEAGTIRFEKESHRRLAEQEAGIGFENRLENFLSLESPGEQEIAGVCDQLKAIGSEKDIQEVVAALTKRKDLMSPEATIAILETLKEMAKSHQSKALLRRMLSIQKMLGSENELIAVLAAENLGAWGVSKAADTLTRVVQESDRKSTVRRSAAVALAKVGNSAALETLVRLSSASDPETRYVALCGLAAADPDQAARIAANLLAEDPGSADPVPAILAMLKQRRGDRLLTDALQGAVIHPNVSEAVNEFHRASGLLPETLAERFRSSPRSTSLTELLLAEDQRLLTRDVETSGDAARGEIIYRRKALSCTNCHAIGTVGGLIGPNLVAVGAAAKTGYIVESILKPNQAIAEHYENRLFLLEDGTTRTGIISFRSDQRVVVRDASKAGREVNLSVDEILAEKAMPSAMPAGLADQLSDRQEFLDLAKFVASLGKPGVYANDESPVIRKWQVIAVPAGSQIPPESDRWQTVYGTVGGELPTADLPLGERVIARGHVNVQVAGAIRLLLNAREGLKVWVDDVEWTDPSDAIHLAQGRRALTFAIKRTERGERGLRVEPEPAPGSAIKFQPEGGR
jgi:putative heme-binding domain-containing protein